MSDLFGSSAAAAPKQEYDASQIEVLEGLEPVRMRPGMYIGGTDVIRDNGRGIPVDEHPKFPGKSALEVILTTLHSGGKFTGKAYQTSGGLHGVGISVVNALSDRMWIEIAKNKKLYKQSR